MVKGELDSVESGGIWGLWSQMVADEFSDDQLADKPELLLLQQEVRSVDNEAGLVNLLVRYQDQTEQFQALSGVLQNIRTKAYSQSIDEQNPDGEHYKNVYYNITRAYAGLMLINSARGMGIDLETIYTPIYQNALYKMKTNGGEIILSIKTDPYEQIKNKVRHQNKRHHGEAKLTAEQLFSLRALQNKNGFGLVPTQIGNEGSSQEVYWANIPIKDNDSLESLFTEAERQKWINKVDSLFGRILLLSRDQGNYFSPREQPKIKRVVNFLTHNILPGYKIMGKKLEIAKGLGALDSAKMQQQITECLLAASQNPETFEDCLVSLEHFWKPGDFGAKERKNFLNGVVNTYMFVSTALKNGFDVRATNPRSDAYHSTDYLIRPSGTSKWYRVDVKSSFIEKSGRKTASFSLVEGDEKKLVIAVCRPYGDEPVSRFLLGKKMQETSELIRYNILADLFVYIQKKSHAQT